jgi:hypothetical protein
MDDLLAANPGIDPRILSIDQEIIIPLGEGDLVSDFLPTATPIPVQLSKVDCYPNQIRGLLCISTLENDSGGDLEAVSVVISIQDRNGAILREKTAFSPLNIIPESAQFPFAVTFDDFTDEFAYAMVTPVSAFPARAISERYSSVEIMLDVSEPSSDLISWWVEGRILSESREGYKPKQTSILIVALDEDKHVIGFRTIKIDPKDSTDDEISFAIEVPSLGPPIHQIALYSEIPLESGEE